MVDVAPSVSSMPPDRVLVRFGLAGFLEGLQFPRELPRLRTPQACASAQRCLGHGAQLVYHVGDLVLVRRWEKTKL